MTTSTQYAYEIWLYDEPVDYIYASSLEEARQRAMWLYGTTGVYVVQLYS